MQTKHGTAEDLGAILGLEGALRLMAGYGGGIMKIPRNAMAGHPFAELLGLPGMRALCSEYGGQHLWIPHHADDDAVIIRRACADLVKRGHGKKEIAHLFHVSERQVCAWIGDAERLGFIKMVLAGNDDNTEGQAA